MLVKARCIDFIQFTAKYVSNLIIVIWDLFVICFLTVS